MNKATRLAVIKTKRLEVLQNSLAPLSQLPEERVTEIVKTDPALQAQVDEMFRLITELRGK